METAIQLGVWDGDEDLERVRQAQEGSRAAFDVLFDRHKKFVYNVCYRMLGSADDATDATQNAFIQAYRALGQFGGRSSFRSWLYRIAVNTCIGMLRKDRRQKDLAAEIEHQPPSIGNRDRVWEAVLGMPPDMRAVLVLSYFQGLTSEEIGEALDCSAGAVRTRLHRARAAFKKKYEELER